MTDPLSTRAARLLEAEEYQNPPHVREDYRDVWQSGYRAGVRSALAELTAAEAQRDGVSKAYNEVYEALTAAEAERDRLAGELGFMKNDLGNAIYRTEAAEAERDRLKNLLLTLIEQGVVVMDTDQRVEFGL